MDFSVTYLDSEYYKKYTSNYDAKCNLLTKYLLFPGIHPASKQNKSIPLQYWLTINIFNSHVKNCLSSHLSIRQPCSSESSAQCLMPSQKYCFLMQSPSFTHSNVWLATQGTITLVKPSSALAIERLKVQAKIPIVEKVHNLEGAIQTK